MDIRDSMCNRCVYGQVTKNTMAMSSDDHELDDALDIMSDFAGEERHSVEQSCLLSICHWPNVPRENPIITPGMVQACSRFEEEK